MTRRRPKADQPGLFPDLHKDHRPLGERTAAERYETPSIMSWLAGQRDDEPERCCMMFGACIKPRTDCIHRKTDNDE